MKTRTAGSLNLRTSKLAIAVSLAVCAIATVPGTARAQSAPPAPVRETIDANGVDLFNGKLSVDGAPLTLGGADNALSYRQWNKGAGWSDNLSIFLNLSGSVMTVSLGPDSDSFDVSSGPTYTPRQGNGATLAYNSTSNVYTYTAGDGTVVHFLGTRLNEYVPFSNEGMVTDVVSPNGDKLTFAYEDITYCVPNTAHTACARQTKAYRVASAVSNYGYKLVPQRTEYEWTGDPDNPADQPDFAQWAAIAGVNGLNLASSTTTVLASESFATTVSGGVTTYAITDPAGHQTKYRLGSAGEVAGITLPGDTSEFETVTYSSGRVSSLTRAGVTTSYSSPSDSGNDRTVTVTNSASQVWTYLFDIPSQRLKSLTDPQSHVTSYDHDTSGRLTKTTYPEHNYVQLTYDGRGNVTETRAVDKTGTSSSSDIVTTAWYEDCSTAATCNQPTRIHTARGNPTDTDDHTYETVYTYNSDGTLHTVTEPADADGVHPVTTYGYTDLQAYYDIGSGIVASGQHVQRLTSVSRCRTTTSCANSSDEQRQTIGYGAQVTGTGNNLLPVSQTLATGNSSISRTTTLAYDAVGNLISTQGPAGSDDTTIMGYTADRQPSWAIGPDPDGSATAKFPAVRYTYLADGQLDYVQTGTVDAQSSSGLSTFAESQRQTAGYDSAHRLNRQTLSSGSTTYNVTDQVYDSAGRASCSIVRMNPSNWGTQATTCSAGTAGSYGSDRVTLNHYDTLGRVDKVTTGYGTTEAADDATYEFTDNGKVQGVTNALGYYTYYDYDGYDRLNRIEYPDPATPGQSSTTDYEAFAWDANGNLTGRRTRAGENLYYTYDALNRVTIKTVPERTGLPTTDTRDVYYGYDLLGDMTFARFDSTSGEGVNNTFNAIGELTDTLTNFDSTSHTLSYQYDINGKRSRLTFPDSNYVAYDRYAPGGLNAAYLNGSGPLWHVALDTQGRLDAAYRWNATSGAWGALSAYSYDGASRLSGIGMDLTGSTSDVTSTFAFNPAGQIASRSRDNTAYAFSTATTPSGGIAATANGLDQLTAVGSASLSYDANGNLTSDGTNSYTYDVENRLVGKGSSVALRYDPLGRLYEVTGSSSTTRFLYDGDDLVAEYNGSGTLLRRYVHGDGVDQPLVWFEGTGVSNGARNYLYTDERGSIAAVTDNDGTIGAINTYDEYGRPGSSNAGRFQYTGQAWLPELSLSYYKARFYDPKLGRFLQTDPIGYGDGLNIYAHVGGDPVNRVDPWGLADIPVNNHVCTPGDSRLFCQAPFAPGVFTDQDKVCQIFGVCRDPNSGDSNEAPRDFGFGIRPAPSRAPSRSSCDFNKRLAGDLAKGFSDLANTLWAIDVAAGLGTLVSLVGEGPTLGADTLLTASLGATTAQVSRAALFAGAASAALQTYADSGDPSALGSVTFSEWSGKVAGNFLRTLPGVGHVAGLFGSLISQGASFQTQVQSKCQGAF